MAGSTAFPSQPGWKIHLNIEKPGCFACTGHSMTKVRIGQSHSRGVGLESVHVCIEIRATLPEPIFFRTRKINVSKLVAFTVWILGTSPRTTTCVEEVQLRVYGGRVGKGLLQDDWRSVFRNPKLFKFTFY